jgi:hypothetical protein
MQHWAQATKPMGKATIPILKLERELKIGAILQMEIIPELAIATQQIIT